jgi:hypothetical protein
MKAAVLPKGSARPRTAQQSGEDSGHQQEPVRVQSSPHRPMRQKASLSSGGTAGLGIALTGCYCLNMTSSKTGQCALLQSPRFLCNTVLS